MKNTLLIIVILLSFSMKLQAQVREAEEVVDYAAIEADVVYHEEQYGYITEMKESEFKMMNLQDSVKAKVEKIAAIQTEIYRGLTEVNTAIQNAHSLVYAWNIITRITDDVIAIDTLVVGHPELILIANRTEAALIDRLVGLKDYLVLSITGGRVNLMNGVQRTSLINHVLTELYIIQGMVYTIRHQMTMALKQGWLKEMIREYFPMVDYYHRQNTQLAQRIINNFHF
jgi:hypothetical protein